MDIHTGGWDEGLLDLFDAPRGALPEIVDCAGRYGETSLFGAPIPITGMAGDQQAAAIGQACLTPGDTKSTYGTGAFVLTHTGEQGAGLAEPAADHGRLAAWRQARLCAGGIGVRRRQPDPVAARLARDDRQRAGERGAGALGRRTMAGSIIVPALAGLGAPHWRPDARAAISGLSFATGRAHVVRAALEAQAHQTHDLMTAFAADGAAWERLKIDGGMSANDWLAQDLADVLDLEVERPDFVETTALGAAMLAGVGAGLFGSLEEAAAMRGAVRTLRAGDDRGDARAARLARRGAKAVAAACSPRRLRSSGARASCRRSS